MEVKLVMFKSDGQRKDFPLTKPVTTIGRGRECDLQVPVTNVSRRHCEIVIDDDEVDIRDLGSSNGTFVNNKRVTEAELDAGYRITLGPVIFTVWIDGYPKQIEPVFNNEDDSEAAADSDAGFEAVLGLDANQDDGDEAISVAQMDDTDTPETAEADGDDQEDVDPLESLEILGDQA